MIKKITLLFYFLPLCILAQQSYYDDTAVYLTGEDLYFELQQKLSQYNTSYTYNDFKQTTKITDQNPSDSNEVLLVYGFNDSDGDCTTDRTRDNDNFGGNNCQYNREHVFARSLANPTMGSANSGSTGIVADPHNLRPSDVQRNGNRGSKKFDDGSGNSGDVNSGNWYPGDEWKGDVARAMMYMYVRYGDRCLPSLVGVGPTEGSTDMLQLFLEWNVEDPVSPLEEQRNPQLETEYGSRNPFIDNPILATNIWGGTPAEDKWGPLGLDSIISSTFSMHPNPAYAYTTISTSQPVNNIAIYTLVGQRVFSQQSARYKTSFNVDISNFNTGVYLIKINNSVEKLIVQ